VCVSDIPPSIWHDDSWSQPLGMKTRSGGRDPSGTELDSDMRGKTLHTPNAFWTSLMAAMPSARYVSGMVVYPSLVSSLNKNIFLLSRVYLGQVIPDNGLTAVEPLGWLGF